MSQLKVNSIVDAAGGSSAVLYGVASPPNSMGFRNRIINGEMRIDQRNNGASVTPAAPALTYTVDRWGFFNSTGTNRFSAQRNAGSVTPPAGFTNYLGFTVTSAYTPSGADEQFLSQQIEGFNVADLGWGTSNAQAVTATFWVRSSITGTHSGAVRNPNGYSRSYPFTFTVSAANTWEQKTITIPGDTGGTWNTNNAAGIQFGFNLGSGPSSLGTASVWSATNAFTGATGSVQVSATNGATFYITGVQLEAGTVASPFERRDYGRELMMCQRYFWRTEIAGAGNAGGTGSIPRISISYPCTMRAAPTISWVSGGQFSDGISFGNITGLSTTAPYTAYANMEFNSTLSGGAQGRGAAVYNAILAASAEL